MSDASFQPEEPELRGQRPLQGLRTLAAIGGFAAAGYWALYTFLLGASGQSTAQLVLPFILIGLYAYRGYQLLQGNITAANNLMWLHGIGAAVAIYQLTTAVGSPLLDGVKIAIHLFGFVTALLVIQKSRA